MKFILSSILGFSVLAVATPIAKSDKVVAERAIQIGVLFDESNFWGNNVPIAPNTLGSCVTLSSPDTASSILMFNSGVFACRFYDNVDCNNNQGNLDNIRSNVADLNSIGWNDRIASYLCVAV